MCPGPTPLQSGEKAQLLETECLSLKQRGVLDLGRRGPCSVVQRGSRFTASGRRRSCCRGCLSAAAAAAKLFRICWCLQKRRQLPGLRFSCCPLVGPVGEMCPQYRIPNCSLLCVLVSLWGCHIQFGMLGSAESHGLLRTLGLIPHL